MSDANKENPNGYDAIETPHNLLLEKLLSNERFSDLALEGNDGIKIQAIRCILAARSEVFRKMLYGDFREATTSVVRVDYPGEVLKALVQYCYTDRVTLFNIEEEKKGQQQYSRSYDDTWARKIVELNTAADFFGLGGLQQQIYSVACSKMANNGATLSCSFFDAARQSDLGKTARLVIRERPQDALFPSSSCGGHPGILSLNSTSLSDVAGDPMLAIDDFTLFRALKAWSEADISMIPPLSSQDFCPLKRKRLAAELVAKNVDLKRIKPSDICTSVERSGLVTANAVANTFKAQALMFEKMTPAFHLPLWKGSNDSVFCRHRGMNEKSTGLQCFPMKDGLHTWTMEYRGEQIKGKYYDELGIASAILKRSEWLSSTPNTGWAIQADGRKKSSFGHDGTVNLNFQKGSIITFTLDLTKDGCLSVGIDYGDSIILFDNIRSNKNDESVDTSFFPAVSLSERSSVRMLNFKSKQIVNN